MKSSAINIWTKYITKKFLTTFALLLFGFYALFILLDFSAHSSYFPKNMDSRYKNIIIFYLCEFINRVDVLIPFALLIACIKTLSELNLNNEIVGMLAGGVSKKKILAPLLCIGIFFSVLMYLNAQFLVPISLNKLKMFSDEKKRYKKKKNELPFVQHLSLQDSSLLIFQDYNPEKKYFFDVYWVPSIDEIYRMEILNLNHPYPEGNNVQHFVRSENGSLFLKKFEDKTTFSNLFFNKHILETMILPEELSLTQLWEKIQWHGDISSEKGSKILTLFFFKMIIPWICIFVILLPAPFCMTFSRNYSVFFIYAFSIIGLVSFFTIHQSLEILSKRQVIHPQWIVIAALSLFCLPSAIQYVRLK